MVHHGEGRQGPGLGRLSVVRHGESVANAVFARAVATGDAGLVVEGTDARVGLSERGVREARALGRWLAGAGAERPGLAVVSPYVRARQTWEAMAVAAGRAGAEVPAALVDERLRDREMGVLELLPPPAVAARAPEEAARRERLGEWFYRPPGGESLADVVLRVRDFLTELRADPPCAHVLLVAHDSVAVAVRQVLAGIGAPPAQDVPVPNASVSVWERAPAGGDFADGGPTGGDPADGRRLRLVEFGGVRHLGAECGHGRGTEA
ncbi:histidine phosphatase family protein [Streptomyces tremellae]|uniref:Histidine phosphatase family protein n=1 Tax=Streptomyces tremellae TaxID=1124239 RepID=A0ABP7FEY1_9ACTN